MGDGWALQAGTSHFLGQNFARAFEIKFLDEDNQEKFVFQTSWGVSTRLLGALVMVHGDDKGLRLPPRLAPIQLVLVPILFDKRRAPDVLQAAARLADDLAARGLRVRVDDRDWLSPGFKYNDWELRGVPLRLELGPRDLDKGLAVLVPRQKNGSAPKRNVPLQDLPQLVPQLLDEAQAALLAEADAFLAQNTKDVSDYETFKTLIDEGRSFLRAPWDGDPQTEELVKAETKATIRCIPLQDSDPSPDQNCVRSGRPARHVVIFARNY
jgi:prolyl-tRNA synthetase